MTTASPLLRTLLVALLCLPPMGLVRACREARGTQSADETLEGSVLIVALMGAVAGLGVVVLIKSAVSARMSQPEKLLATGVAMSVVPLYFLLSATSWYIGWPTRGASVLASGAVFALNGLWVVLVVATWKRLERLRTARLSATSQVA
jgi:hypothetical protein